jgi:hypothetical protein
MVNEVRRAVEEQLLVNTCHTEDMSKLSNTIISDYISPWYGLQTLPPHQSITLFIALNCSRNSGRCEFYTTRWIMTTARPDYTLFHFAV